MKSTKTEVSTLIFGAYPTSVMLRMKERRKEFFGNAPDKTLFRPVLQHRALMFLLVHMDMFMVQDKSYGRKKAPVDFSRGA